MQPKSIKCNAATPAIDGLQLESDLISIGLAAFTKRRRSYTDGFA